MGSIYNGGAGACSVGFTPDWAVIAQPAFLSIGADVSFVAGGADPAAPRGFGRWIKLDQDKANPAAIAKLGILCCSREDGDATARWARTFKHLYYFTGSNGDGEPDAQALMWKTEPHATDINLELYINTDRTLTLKVINVGDQTDTFTSTEVLTKETVYQVEVWYIFRDSGGNYLANTQVVVRVISSLGGSPVTTTFINDTTTDAGSIGFPSVGTDYIEFGEDTDHSFTQYFANLWSMVEDADDPCGQVRIVRATPSGDHGVAAREEWNIFGAPANYWECWDDDPGAAEATDYLLSTLGQNGEQHTSDVPDSLVGANDVLYCLFLYDRWKKSQAAKTGAVKFLLYDPDEAAGVTTGGVTSTDTNWHDQHGDDGVPQYCHVAPDLSPWTPTHLDSLELGVESSVDVLNTVLCTMIFGMMAYEADADGSLAALPAIPVGAAVAIAQVIWC